MYPTNPIEILLITHTPYVSLAIVGIIILRKSRKELELLNKKLGRY